MPLLHFWTTAKRPTSSTSLVVVLVVLVVVLATVLVAVLVVFLVVGLVIVPVVVLVVVLVVVPVVVQSNSCQYVTLVGRSGLQTPPGGS